MNITLRQICKKVAEELNLPVADVEEIMNSQSSFVMKVINSGEFKNIRLQYLGLFKVLDKRVERRERMLAKKLLHDQQRELYLKRYTEPSSEEPSV